MFYRFPGCDSWWMAEGLALDLPIIHTGIHPHGRSGSEDHLVWVWHF